MRAFSASGNRVLADLTELDTTVLRIVPRLIGGVADERIDPAAQRLSPEVYRDDPAKSDEFRRLSHDMIDAERAEDLRRFAAELEDVVAGTPLDAASAEAWMRVISTARLILGARIGIESDGWEQVADPEQDPRVAMLWVLGRLQTDLVSVLSDIHGFGIDLTSLEGFSD